ncbi:MAG: HAD family phosphatase [Bacteroidetes bacterium]|nr:HAD family phosphatase [Bacteroidota bacterium]
MVPHEIKNIIFDLGGVILDLDVSKTHQAFGEMAGLSAKEIQAKSSTEPFFNDFEKGLLSDHEFRQRIKSFLNKPATNEEIDAAWNAMLVKIPTEKYELLLRLRETHRVFLLSNTNNIHLEYFNQLVYRDTGHPELDYFFHKAYYSHLMKMRKPDQEIYARVLNENNLSAGETLFLDDNFDNIEGAARVGIQTIHVTSPSAILSLFA